MIKNRNSGVFPRYYLLPYLEGAKARSTRPGLTPWAWVVLSPATRSHSTRPSQLLQQLRLQFVGRLSLQIRLPRLLLHHGWNQFVGLCLCQRLYTLKSIPIIFLPFFS